MLARLGYDPDAYPPNYGEADSFVANNTLLIKHNQQYWLQQALAAQQLTKTQGAGMSEQPVVANAVVQPPNNVNETAGGQLLQPAVSVLPSAR
jgi:hypothetical protein